MASLPTMPRLFTSFVSVIPKTSSTLTAGQRLPAILASVTSPMTGDGQMLQSPSFKAKAILLKSGDFNLYRSDNNQLLWSSGTAGKGVAYATLQSDGNFVLYTVDNKPVWATGTNKPGSVFKVEDNGTMNVYSVPLPPGRALTLWSVPPKLTPPVVKHDTLASGQSLLPNTRLKAPNKKAYAILQADGNFVVYQTNGPPLWATGTQGQQVSSVKMQTDGNLVLLNKDGNPVWATMSQGNPGAWLVMQDDGNMVIKNYNPNLKQDVAVWASDTYDFVSHKQDKTIFGPINDAIDAIADVATSVITRIPGEAWVAGQVEDFAKTSVGKTFLRGISAVIVPVLFTVNPGLGLVVSSAIGGALGTAAFVMPGLLRGEPIDEAFLNECKYVATKFGAEFSDHLGEAAKAVEQWGDQHGIDFDQLANQGIDARNLIAKGVDAKTLAAIAHVPPEVAQLAIDAATRTTNAAGLTFDEDGNVVVPALTRPFSAATMDWNALAKKAADDKAAKNVGMVIDWNALAKKAAAKNVGMAIDWNALAKKAADDKAAAASADAARINAATLAANKSKAALATSSTKTPSTVPWWDHLVGAALGPLGLSALFGARAKGQKG